MEKSGPLRRIPSVDKLLSSEALQKTLAEHGHTRTRAAIREVLGEIREQRRAAPAVAEIAAAVADRISAQNADSLIRVFNLTGTVLHTNLGRACLPETALDAVVATARGNSNLEFDLAAGTRGDRDDHIAGQLQALTGAEAVTVVNNNAAAVLLCLNTFAFGREVCISRGELVEIGGSFRIPEIMKKSGCRLREVGTTNRTHLQDYGQAISDETGLLMKVHTSNYEIRGFTGEVSYRQLSALADERNLPLLADLGSGTLINLEDHGLTHEPTVQEVLAAGVGLLTFSGDKLLGGPQAGIIAGKRELIAAVKRNPLKRALRVDKMTLAALSAVLKLYRHPETLAAELPTLKHLSRQPGELRALAESLLPCLRQALGGTARVEITPATSQIGSGALPVARLASIAIRITPWHAGDSALRELSLAFRRLPTPVIGRLQDGSLLFDLRTLDAAEPLIEQVQRLAAP